MGRLFADALDNLPRADKVILGFNTATAMTAICKTKIPKIDVISCCIENSIEVLRLDIIMCSSCSVELSGSVST